MDGGALCEGEVEGNELLCFFNSWADDFQTLDLRDWRCMVLCLGFVE